SSARKDSVLSVNKVADAEIMISSVPPRAAFEVFMGKVYTGVDEDLSDSIGPAGKGSESSRGAWYGAVFGAADGKGGAGVESPMERLLRLKAEAAQLGEDLEEMSKGNKEGCNKEEEVGEDSTIGGGGGGTVTLWGSMARETAVLQQRLSSLATNPKYKRVVSPLPSVLDREILQHRLSGEVLSALESIRRDAASKLAGVEMGAKSGEGE
ncbi:unnamed protein product, partial [Discosporangium mesarthrocarpum]